MFFIGGDNFLVYFYMEISERKSLLVVKDLFGNVLIFYFIVYYKDIYVVDYCYFKGNILCLMKCYDIKELFYVYNIFVVNIKIIIKFGL